MPLATSYPNKQVPIIQSDTVDVTQKDSTGQSRIVGLLPLADGFVTVRLQDDDNADFPSGVTRPVTAGIPIVGRVLRVFATGTDLADADMIGLEITR